MTVTEYDTGWGEMDDKEVFLEKLLTEYRKSFDIVRNYEIGGLQAAAYGYFSAVSEKYVLNPKANLWSIHGYEHILFFPCESVTMQDIEKAHELMSGAMAPQLVCRGRKYPEKDHMYSYLTVAFLCDHTPEDGVLKAVRNFSFEKNYLLTIRGYAQGHLVLMDLSAGKAYANRAGRHLAEYYEKIFRGTNA